MKTKKENRSSKLLLLGLSAIGAIFLVGVLTAISLNAQNQIDSDKERMKQIERGIKQQEAMFWKVSSTAKAADDGNRIIAVRRINLVFDDRDLKGNTFRNTKKLYEIELYSKVPVPVTNSMQYLIIGDLAIPEPLITGDRHTIFAHLQQKEFENLRNDPIISYTISPVPIDTEYIRQSYKDGEPAEIAGAKFGRLDKKAAELLPIIDEDSKTQLFRLTGVKQN